MQKNKMPMMFVQNILILESAYVITYCGPLFPFNNSVCPPLYIPIPKK